jgi:hypothetical protein
MMGSSPNVETASTTALATRNVPNAAANPPRYHRGPGVRFRPGATSRQLRATQISTMKTSSSAIVNSTGATSSGSSVVFRTMMPTRLVARKTKYSARADVTGRPSSSSIS